MLILPERMRVAHLAQGVPDLQHGRVRRQHVERLAWRGRGEGRLYGFLAVGDYGAYGELGVREAPGHVCGPDAADGERCGARPSLLPRVGEHLEVHIPEPRDVAAVGVVVVYGDKDVAGFGARYEGAQDLVEPDGVLDEQQEGFSVPHLYPLDPPEGSPEPFEATGDLRKTDPGLSHHRGRGKRVVDVVEPGEANLYVHLALRGREQELRAMSPLEPHPARAVHRLRPREVAVVAVVDADVPHVHDLVDEGCSAHGAVFGVSDVLQTSGVQRRLIHTVEDESFGGPPEARDEGIVRVQDHSAALRQVPERRGYDLARIGELPVAVELVPEQVENREDPDLRLRGHLRHARLVHLEEPHLRERRPGQSRVRDEGRGHAGNQVGPRRVVHGKDTSGLQYFGHHPGRRRLAVGTRYRRRPEPQPPRELEQYLRVHPARHDPWHRRAPSCLQRPARKARRVGGQYRG